MKVLPLCLVGLALIGREKFGNVTQIQLSACRRPETTVPYVPSNTVLFSSGISCHLKRRDEG